MGEKMKNNITIWLICILGSLQHVNAAEEKNWKQLNTDNTTLYSIHLYNSGEDCQPYKGIPQAYTVLDVADNADMLVFDIDGDLSTGHFYRCECLQCDHSCANNTIIAVAGYADPVRVDEALEGNTKKDGYGYKWKCDQEGFLEGFDEWWYDSEIEECYENKYKRFKGKPNAIPVLVDPKRAPTDFYYTYINPSSAVCIAYVCNPDTSVASYDPFDETEMRGRSYECVTHNPKCSISITKNGKSKDIKMPTGYRFDTHISGSNSLLKTANIENMLDAIYTNIHTPENQNIIKKLLDLKIKDASAVFEKAENGGGHYNMLETALTDQTFDLRCYEHGLQAILINCPPFFIKQQQQDGNYTCIFDADTAKAAIQGAKETAAKNAKDACQNALCTATGGTMNESGCMCGEDECNNKYTDSNGNTYNYCGIKGEQPKAYCNGTQYIKITNRTQADTANNNKFYQKLNNNGIDSIFEEACPTSNAMSDSGDHKPDIPTLVANLSKIESEFGLSKWRTAEGKFNYARLASDATAGIVLGTTGALVTAHVVKKKQVEDGFESLECTVGGQHVGDWGDVFRIDGK